MNTRRYTVLITSAGSGLGRGLALCLSRRCHAVLAAGLRPEAAQETSALVAAEEEVAVTVEYLAGPLARNVTGQTITIDGRWTSG